MATTGIPGEPDVNLFHLCQSIEDLLSLKAESKGLELKFFLDQDVPQYITTDAQKLKQILINLLGNALKFTEQGCVDCFVSVEASQEDPPSHQLHFKVQDTGVGIPDTFIDKIFLPFEQNPPTRVKYGGIGLGLSICKEFVNFLGGELHLTSQEGQGTRAEFFIPIGLGHQPCPSEPTARQIVALAKNQPTYRLLVVEDQKENREPLVRLLQSVGYEVLEALNGQQALTLNRHWRPHLILMDLQLPLLNGLETTQQIKSEDASSPIIVVLTAQAYMEDEARLAGCDDFIQKPFLAEETLHKLAEHLGATYTYQTLKPQNTYEPVQYKLKAEHLQVMPQLWIQSVFDESIKLDHDALISLFSEIPSQHQTLQSSLQLLVERCRFDIIMDAAQEALKGLSG